MIKVVAILSFRVLNKRNKERVYIPSYSRYRYELKEVHQISQYIYVLDQLRTSSLSRHGVVCNCWIRDHRVHAQARSHLLAHVSYVMRFTVGL